MNGSIISVLYVLIRLYFRAGCGFWTYHKEAFDHRYTPELDLDNENVIQREPALEGFVRFWTYIIVFQVCVQTVLWLQNVKMQMRLIVCELFSYFCRY